MVEFILDVFASASVVRRDEAAGAGGFGGVETRRDGESTS